jgi:hypothetical protein
VEYCHSAVARRLASHASVLHNRILPDTSTIMRARVLPPACIIDTSCKVLLTTIMWFDLNWDDYVTSKNRMVTHRAHALSVCVAPSFSRSLAPWKPWRLPVLRISSSNLFAARDAVRLLGVQFRVRQCGVRGWRDQPEPPLAFRTQSPLETPRQCRAS